MVVVKDIQGISVFVVWGLGLNEESGTALLDR